MVKKILVALVVAVLLFVGVVATRPATYRVERVASMAAPPQVVYAQIADFHRWERWSPWATLDPQMKVTFDGPAAGVGAAYGWSGNDKVGEGRMTITAAAPGTSVDIRLEFLKPWKSTNAVEFRLASEAGGTRVAWVMNGRNDFTGKAFSMFMNMDQMIGKDFEIGLAQLRDVVEAAVPAR